MTDPAHPFELVTVVGGSGFLGDYVVNALAKRGYRVRVAVRRPNAARIPEVFGMVGQVHSVQANLRYPESVRHALRGAGAVVNLVGILQRSGAQTFEAVQAEGARTVAEAAAAVGARLVHVSALGAALGSGSADARSKAEGELAVKKARPDAVVFRPSLMFGPGDSFFNRFATLSRMLPVLPLAGADTRFQPVYAGDVAEAIARAVDGQAQPGGIYELGGPEVLTFRQCLERVLQVTGRRRALLPVPFGIAQAMGNVLQHLPGGLLTADQVRMLRFDTIVSEPARAEGRTLEGLGIEPTALDLVLPTYLARFRPQGEFTQIRPVG